MNKQQINDIKKEVQEKLGIKHSFSVPKMTKIVINMGVKDALTDKKSIEAAKNSMEQITGQKPKITKAKKSIASFKLREGDTVGLMATLRGKRMYDFYEKLIAIVLPRIRDFHGVSRSSFDKHGNYSLGFSEHTVFPEIDSGKTEKLQGLEITIVTTAKNDAEGLSMLEALHMPFEKAK